jgi:protoporphyrinogen oxidase
VQAEGTKVVMNSMVTRIRRENGRAVAVDAVTAGEGATSYPVDAVISSMPFSELLEAMDPAVPAEVRQAAEGLMYRDFLTVALVVPADKVKWDDNWIYIHAPEVKTMRIQNFGSWSPYLVRDGHNVLGLEYTVLEGDSSWNASDEELIEQAKIELESLGLMRAIDVERGYVVRQTKAYPIYDEHYQANVEVLRRWIEAEAPNVHPVGRNGMFRYNNQDHSMFTAMLTVENIVAGAQHDIWSVNVEEDYHEEQTGKASSSGSSTGRDAPTLPRAAIEAGRAARQA